MQKEKTAKTESRLTNNPIAAFIKRNGGTIIGLLILCVAVQINTPKFLTWNNIVGVLRQISTNLYVACAITMILIAGGIDLSAGAVISLSSVVVSTCLVNYGLPIPLAILAGSAILLVLAGCLSRKERVGV